MAKGVAEEYASSLADLTVNSKPLINMLTMLAEDYIQHAPIIVMAVEAHLQKVRGEFKLPALYLIDSIVKNVGKAYIQLFTQNIVSTFCSVFEKVDEKVRAQMFKLRLTWNAFFPAKKLYALDARVHTIDPAWPITAPPPSSIHVNPKFLQATPSPPDPGSPISMNDGAMREQLLKKQKELLELQKRKVELELLQTKAILEEQQKKLENQTAGLKPVDSNLKSPVLLSPIATKPETNMVVDKGFSDKTAYVPQIEPERLSPLTFTSSGSGKYTNQQVQNSLDKNTSENIPHSVRSRDPRIERKKEIQMEKKMPLRLEKSGNLPPLPKASEIINTIMGSDFICSGNITQKAKKDKRKKMSFKRKTKGIHHKESVSLEISTKEVQLSIKENVKKESKLKLEKETRSVNLEKPKNNKHSKNSTEKKNIETLTKSSTRVSLPQLNNEPLKRSKPSKNGKVLANSERGVDETVFAKGDNIGEVSKGKRKCVIIEVEADSKKLCTLEKKKELISDIQEQPVLSNQSSKINTNLSKVQKYLFSSRSEASSPKPVDSTAPTSVTKVEELREKDIDLRLLPPQSTSKRSSDSQSSTAKKSKSEVIDSLFGEKDVDLRTPHPPSPPPPPIISETVLLEETNGKLMPEKSWAKFKQTKSEGKSDEKKTVVPKQSRVVKSLFSHQPKGEEVDDNAESEDYSNANCNLIIKQAEEQFSTGNITFTQYNRMLKEVITINEEMKLKEAQRKDKLESSDDTHISKEILEESPSTKQDDDKETKETKVTKESSTDEWPDESGNWEKVTSKEPINLERFNPETQSRVRNTHIEADGRKYMERDRHQNRNFHRPIGNETFCGSYENNINKSIQGQRQWMMNMPPPPPPPPPPPMVQPAHNVMPVHHNEFHRWTAPVPQRPVLYNDRHQYFPPSRSSITKPLRYLHREVRDVPTADPVVLDLISKDTMHTISIDGIPREVRFYGETAIIMLSWDDSREITFQPGSRRVLIDDMDTVSLSFNHPYREFLTNGKRIKMRLGAPTRELYIDGQFYEVIFGGPPLQVMLGNRLHTIKLEGPNPQVRVGTVKRTELVAGKINLIVDAKHMYALYLDAKPQRIDIDGVPFILRFVEALKTLVINGRPFKIEFGGLPIPISFRGMKHYLRLSVIPHSVKPGHVNIVNMEGGRLPTPPPSPPPPIIISNPKPNIDDFNKGLREEPLGIPGSNVGVAQQMYPGQENSEQPLELLTSLMPTALAPSTGQSYTVEQPLEGTATNSAPPSLNVQNSPINVGELFQKLVAIGIVPPTTKEKDQSIEDNESIRPVDFSLPETLKIKQPGLIKRLYTGIQCSSCGVRFSPEETVKYSQHLDWHFRQNRRDRDTSKIAQSRRWYYDVSDWVQYQEIEDLDERAQSWFEAQDKRSPAMKDDTANDEPSVAAGDNGENALCAICEDKFEQFYNEEKEEWHLRKAVRIEEKVYHPLCYQDFKESESRRANIQLETQEIDSSKKGEDIGDEVETISIDDTVNGEEVHPVSEETVVIDDIHSTESSNTEPVSISEVQEMHFDLEEKPSEIEETLVTLKDPSEKISNGSIEEDDDIIHVEILERKIESYEILDDDDENNVVFKSLHPDGIIKETTEEKEDDLDNIDYTKVKIKTERIEIPEPIVDTTHTSLTATIDGNVEFEEAPPPILPGRIKINISKAIRPNKQPNPQDQSGSFKTINSPPQERASVLAIVEQNQPPPPGEELCPARIKPKIVGTKLTEVSPLRKGNDLSGLCCIM